MRAQIGRITGARIILTGKIVRLESAVWQVSAEFTDVETSETLRAGSIIYKGDTVGLITNGIPELADKLLPEGDPSVFGSVISFLMQKTSSLLQSGKSDKDESRDKTAEPQPQQKAEPEPGQKTGFRLWASPDSFFSFGFEDGNNKNLETIEGEGVSLAFEREFDKAWAIGTSLSFGSLTSKTSTTSGSGLAESVSGDYSAFTFFIMDSVPNGNPWFYYGTGIMYASVDFEDAAGSGSDSLLGVLLLLRVAYNFDSGVFMGLDIQNSVFSSSEGTRHEELSQAGVAGASAEASVSAVLLGYSF